MNAVAFFYEHAGYSFDPLTETAEQGRQRTAERYAAAEAAKGAIAFEWFLDELSTSADWCECTCNEDGEEGCGYHSPWLTWTCVAHRDNDIVASLCSIDFGRDGEPWGDPHRRVVEAELAIEADVLDSGA